MVAPAISGRRSGPFTYADLEATPDDGNRYELLDGVLLVNPSPRTAHQVCVGALYVLLRAARAADQVVFVAPFDVVFSDVTVLEPDVLVARRADLTGKNLPAPPLLAVEVLSPSTRRIDSLAKRSAYEEFGVPAYWLVDPDEPAVTILELDDHGRYQEVAHAVGAEEARGRVPFPVTVVPDALLDDLRG